MASEHSTRFTDEVALHLMEAVLFPRCARSQRYSQIRRDRHADDATMSKWMNIENYAIMFAQSKLNK